MVKFFIIGGIAVVVIAAVIAFFFIFGATPDLTKYEVLKNPRIVQLPGQKMLEIRLTGNPDKLLPDAFSKLFQAYYALKETPKGPAQPAPRLRCPLSEDIERAFGDGGGSIDMQVGIPLPDSVVKLAGGDGSQGTPHIAVWDYGYTAEILHIGPYEKETPTINSLLGYVKAQGYEHSGIHEEEYLVGPGMFGTSPDKYYTIIRYPVTAK